MTKAELELRVAELEEKLNKVEPDLKEFENIKIQQQEWTQKMFDKTQEFNVVKKELKEKEKILDGLSKQFNGLATLFDEYMLATGDMIQTNKLFLRASERAKELLEIKIRAFNGEERNKK